MPVSAVEGLRLVNGRLTTLLGSWQAEPIDPTSLQPQVLTALLADLQQVARWLSAIPPDSPRDGDFAREVAEYRGNVQRLEELLPRLQGWMLAEKARLDGVRAHLAAAGAWVEGRRKIL
jgi:hypothetical protein